jgi:hypothetical protein
LNPNFAACAADARRPEIPEIPEIPFQKFEFKLVFEKNENPAVNLQY